MQHLNRSRSVGTFVRHDNVNPFMDPGDPQFGVRAEGASDPATPSPPRVPVTQIEAADLRGTAAWLLNRRHGKSLRGAKDAAPPAQGWRSPRRSAHLRGSLMAPPSFAGPAMQNKAETNLMLDTDDAYSSLIARRFPDIAHNIRIACLAQWFQRSRYAYLFPCHDWKRIRVVHPTVRAEDSECIR